MKFNTYLRKDFDAFAKDFRVNFVQSLNGFKSINLCGTIGRSGTNNLAIFNTVIHVGSNPPLLGLLVRPPVSQRDTLTNIRDTGFFTINHVSEQIYFRAHQTSANYATEMSEFKVVNLTAEYTASLIAPYVKESMLKIGLKLTEELVIKSNNTIFLIGEIIEAIVPAHCVLNDGLIDLRLAGTITGSALDTYYSVQPIARLSYAKPDKDLDKIG
jgi:flavin reductase (DIM6/NTAB) family NADH-FMN oxidoreductase RutF